MKKPMFLTLFAACGVLGACADTAEPDPEGSAIVEPSLSDKSDSLSAVRAKGDLEYGEPVTDQFVEDLSFHGYEFRSRPGGVVTAEITHKGSSRSLDTTLFLFGKRGPGDWERVASDDDDGFGDLSKLADLELSDFGQYMLVVGTADGMGRGNYRLELTCQNDACIDHSLPTAECGDTMYDLYDTCVEHMLDNTDFGPNDHPERFSVEFCVDDGGVFEEFALSCGNTPEPDWCAFTSDDVDDAMDACKERLESDFFLGEPILLEPLDLPASLEELNGQLGSDDGVSDEFIAGFTVPSGATSDELAHAVRVDFGQRHLTILGELDREHFVQSPLTPMGIVEPIESEFGTEYRVNELTGSFFTDTGEEHLVEIDVLYYTALESAIVIYMLAGPEP